MLDGANQRKPARDQIPLGPGAAQLSTLLDSLLAVRLEIGNDLEGEKALSASPIGKAKLLQVRTALDIAIRDLKRVLDKTDRRHPVDDQQRQEGAE